MGDRLREILLERGRFKIYGRAEVLLFNASRAELVREVLKPALDAGKIVVCDRYTDSSLAYQGSRQNGLSFDEVAKVNDFATGSLRPDITFLYGHRTRIRTRTSPIIMECSTGSHTQDSKQSILNSIAKSLRIIGIWQRSEPERWRVVDASADAKSIAKHVQEIVGEEFTRRGITPKWKRD